MLSAREIKEVHISLAQLFNKMYFFSVKTDDKHQKDVIIPSILMTTHVKQNK